MPLKLTITSFQRLSPDQETTKVLDRGSLSIGRAAQNDWILQDPERILSSRHCVIHYEDGGYFLTDTSTNGTFLNDSDQRIPRNQMVPLEDGDHFVLGEYEIEASLAASAAELAGSESEGPITDVVLAPQGLPIVGVASLGDGSTTPESSFTDLFAEGPEPRPNLQPPTGQSAKGAAITTPPPDLLTPDRAFFKPPDLSPVTPPPPAPKPVENLPPTPPQVDAESAPPAIPNPVAPAAAVEPAANIIPDDWWLAPPAATPTTPRPAVVETPSPPIEPVRTETPSPESSMARSPTPPPVTSPPPAVTSSPLSATGAPTLPLGAATPAGFDAEALIHAFLEGAGLSHARPTQEQWHTIATNLGAIFRETVQGLTDILRARGDVKGEFRLDRTMVGPMENNPLKTPPGQAPLGPEEIMTLLLIRQKDAYMSPVQAVREGFNDIKAHQLAVVAGIQAALNRLLERFDPHNLEARLRQTVFDSILPASRKAKYWDLFTTEYQAIAQEAEEDFNQLFGTEFARAYEERLRTPH